MKKMKIVFIGFKIYKVDEEERTHYHIKGYNLPINKEDILTIIPRYLGHFSEARHFKNLKKSLKYVTGRIMF